MLIEQAIFTSAQTQRLAGYHLVARSPGVEAVDLRELSVWGPSHDSLIEAGADAVSINFHPLPSGAYCVSKTSLAGSEYSGRAGQKVYTQCLVVPADVLACFSNNPFALLTAAFAQGSLRVHDHIPRELEPFRLGGRAAAVDQALLTDLQADPGGTWLAALVQAALVSSSLGLVGGHRRPRLFAGLINCLPPECRTQFSFSSGLKHSPRRPFRVVSVPDDPAEQRRLLRQYDITLLEFSGKPPQQFVTADGWGGFIASAVASGNTAFLGGQLGKPRPKLTVADLPQLGNQLLEAMPASSQTARRDAARQSVAARDSETAAKTHAAHPAPPATEADDQRRADAPHGRPLRAGQTLGPAQPHADSRAPAEIEQDPAQVLGWHCPAAIEKLELLDDTVFEAIAGKAGALDQLRTLWPQVLTQLGPHLVEESREQYIRHALKVWRECVDGDRIRDPVLAMAAMEVVCLLFNE
ncbi:MAG: hypothetical protein WD847_06275 [Pirellulales bacterium]